MQVDEKRIQEIVDKVLLRLSPDVQQTPAEAVMKAADKGTPNTGTSQRPGAFVPRTFAGRSWQARGCQGSAWHHGLFQDIDSATAAAQKRSSSILPRRCRPAKKWSQRCAKCRSTTSSVTRRVCGGGNRAWACR